MNTIYLIPTLKRYFFVFIVGLLLLNPTYIFAQMGDLSIAVPVFESKVIIQTRSEYSGAISSIFFRGKEYIDSRDHGRLLQSASSFDGYGECFNPTEGGASRDSKKQNVSSLKSINSKGNQIWTVVNMGFWLNPKQSYPQGCGGKQFFKQAINTTSSSGHILEKHITVGLLNFPNVINHQVTFKVPSYFDDATFEASTAYVPKEFSHSLFFDSKLGKEIDSGNKQGEQAFPVILATPDGLHAIGVYSPQLPQNEVGYGLFSFPDVNKWNCVFREKKILPKPYSYQCMVVFGTLSEVENTIIKLDLTFGH